MRHVLGLDRVGLYLSLEQHLTSEQTHAFASLVERRMNHEPTAYITGHKEFFGLDFKVGPSVLIPRPDTELLVEKAVELATSVPGTSCLIADIGTGCGAIAISLAISLPQASIYATDISARAIDTARANCRRHGVADRVTLLQGDLLDPLPEPVHLIVANLPYVKRSELPHLTAEIARFEPPAALDGDYSGLCVIERLISGVGKKVLPGGAILLEIAYDEAQAVRDMARQHFPGSSISLVTDLAGFDRVLSIVTDQ